MSTNQQPKVDTLVLDAGPLIERKPLRGLAKRYVTTPQVVQELKDPRVREYFEQLPLLEGVNVEVKMPNAMSVSRVIATAKKTGDYSTLSQPDLCVIALTLECHEATKASSQNTVEVPSDPSGASISEEGSAPTQNEPDVPNSTQNDSVMDKLAVKLDEACLEDTSSSDVDEPESPGPSTAVDPPQSDVSFITASSSTVRHAPQQGTLYEDPSSEDDGEGEWITPTNVRKHQERAKSAALIPAEAEAEESVVPVACMTADFAMQNCLLHLGLQLVSYDGKKVSQVKTHVLRCHACFKICKDQSKKFCPSCGGPTLTRVSVTLKAPDSGSPNQEPELVVHLKKNYQWKLRGTNADLPPPRMGHAKGGGEPTIILREDQKEWERGVRSEALRKKKEERRVQKALNEKEKRGDDAVWMDADWVPSLLAGGGSRPGLDTVLEAEIWLTRAPPEQAETSSTLRSRSSNHLPPHQASHMSQPTSIPVHTALKEYLQEPHLNEPGRISSSDRKWTETKAFLDDLLRFLDSFPRAGLWYSDTAITAKLSLEVISKAFDCLDGIHRGEEGSERSWLTKLLTFVGTMEDWIHRDPELGQTSQGHQPENPSPLQLLNQAFSTLDLVVASFHRDFTPIRGCREEAWAEGKKVTAEFLEATHDMISASVATPFAPFQLHLWKAPRISQLSEVNENGWQAATCLLDLLRILRLANSERLLSCSDFLCDHAQPVDRAEESVVEFCFTVPFPTPARKALAIARLIEVLSLSKDSILSPSQNQKDVVRVLARRLDQGASDDWKVVDEALSEALPKLHGKNLSGHILPELLDLLADDEWRERNKSLIPACLGYLRLGSATAPLAQLHTLSDLIPTLVPEDSDGFLREINERIAFLENSISPKEAADRKRKRNEEEDARSFVEAEVCKVLMQGQTSMGLDKGLRRGDWVEQVIKLATNACLRKLPNTSLKDRKETAVFLKRLPCLINHPHQRHSESPGSQNEAPPRCMSASLSIYQGLLDAKDSRPDTELRRLAFGTISQFLAHSFVNGPDLKKLLPILRAGLTDEDRGVRLEAGIADLELEGDVLLELVAQLGQSTSLIQALAYSQLLSLAKFHEKGPFALLSPHLQSISCFVTARICSGPSHLQETCRFLGRSIPDFLAISQIHTLPELVATKNREAIAAMAVHMDKSVGALLLPLSSKILAHVLMLPGEDESSSALAFFAAAVVEGSHEAIGLDMLLNSHRMEIISELVTSMGEDEQSRKAITALSRLQRRDNRERKLTLGEFLQPHTLGILAHLNSAIISSRGKTAISRKLQVIKSLGALIKTVGPSISNITPQIMALLQGVVGNLDLADSALETWRALVVTLAFMDLAPHVGAIAAAMVHGWPSFSPRGRVTAQEIVNYMFIEHFNDMKPPLDQIVSLQGIPEFERANLELMSHRAGPLEEQLQGFLKRIVSDNVSISTQSLADFKAFMETNSAFFHGLSAGDVFHPIIGQVTRAMFVCGSRDGEEFEKVRNHAYDCIGALGALDPDRFDPAPEKLPFDFLMYNFSQEEESVAFAIHLICDVLAGAYRGANDITYQNNLAYTIQELLTYCGFTAALVQPTQKSLPAVIVHRWRQLDDQVIETVAALLDGRLTLAETNYETEPLPIYPTVSTYREWIQRWSRYLISRVQLRNAAMIFHLFRNVVRNQDVTVARRLLPHLILHLLISGTDADREGIRSEIIVVLEDQVSTTSSSAADKRLLSAQTIFGIMDHISKWIRGVRQELSPKKKSRNHQVAQLSEDLPKVDSLISSINHELTAQAAFQTKAYARALMNFEQLIVMKRERDTSEDDLQAYYDRLHEIYSHLDEPDGMQGVSNLVLAPSLDHQIREHESTGQWTAAQSCWEIKLQKSPDDIEAHLGLIRCLRNLGHYDTLETHIRGVLSRNEHWSEGLAGFRAEGSWIVRNWDAVQQAVDSSKSDSPEISIARVLLALRGQQSPDIQAAFHAARHKLGATILSGGPNSYRRSYDAVIQLHILHELQLAHGFAGRILAHLQNAREPKAYSELATLTAQLRIRLESTLPTFRAREPVLSMHRIALGLMLPEYVAAQREISKAWLSTAKTARKSKHFQTAYSAVLQAREIGDPFAFIESCKLIKADGDNFRALQELENAIDRMPRLDTEFEVENTRLTGKARLFRARWKEEVERFDSRDTGQSFKDACNTVQRWESPWFHYGRFHDSLRTQSSNRAHLPDIRSNYLRTVQTIDNVVYKLPPYQWYSAFPQIVSRIEHPNQSTFSTLSKIISAVILAYPVQALWLFTGVVHSKRIERRRRGIDIINKVKASPSQGRSSDMSPLVERWHKLSQALIELCDAPVDHDILYLSQQFPKLSAMAPSPLLLPLQYSMTVILPSNRAESGVHQPFPSSAPTLEGFAEEIEIMKSLQKPRKLTVLGSDGTAYNFLCKPKDDLRKDARLMDFNSIINKLLKTNSESRRRRLHIRTYSVVPLNEECGLIEWVPNTTGFRHILEKLYTTRGIHIFSRDITEEYNRVREIGESAAPQVFVEKILPYFRPVFHEWFIATFAEPAAWLSARMAYSRTAAVISMVGFILGLGDRHGENILLDTVNGDTVHVDFNCLFERGKHFAVPERVPFRLTNNIVDGMGVTGVEGAFRISCEVTMQILRTNRDTLMSVLEAFVHDPLVEWEDERKKEERSRNRNLKKQRQEPPVHESPAAQLRALAHKSLLPIHKKLRGVQDAESEWGGKEITISNQVESLIKAASSPINLSLMYYGWASWL
ncbi:serine/threonine-protein kinase M1 [Tulasnella sp. 417]|nr:serine/threonine-protein kinase M1 [Tulasnella sp. 417]